MRAIILAAGRGNRLAEFIPDGQPKCLLEFGGRSLLDRQLDILFRLGIKHATLVLGYKAGLVVEHVGTLASRPEVAFFYNPAYKKGSVLSLLAELGVEGEEAERLLQSTPYTIPVHMKMFIGLIREILSDPEIVIYDSLFDGLERRSVSGLIKLIKGFEDASPNRPTLILSTDDRTLKGMESDIVIDLRSGYGDY